MMAYVDVVAVMSQIGDGSRRNNEDNKAKWMVRGWGVCVLFILFFSFLSSFFVFVLYFPLFFLLCFVCFSSLVVCFLVLLYVSFFVFFFPYVLFFFLSPPPSEGVFIGGRGKENYLTLVQSCRRGRVAWAATVQLPTVLVLYVFFFVSMVGQKKSRLCWGF